MTRQEQAAFVRELTRRIEVQTLLEIKTGRVPEEWDGVELRQLLADRFERSVYRRPLQGKRGRLYRDAVLNGNL